MSRLLQLSILFCLCATAAYCLTTSELVLNSTQLSQSYQNSNTTLNLQENETCKVKGGQEWTCKTLEECRHVRGDPVEVCGFQGRQPIICCRPPRRVRSASKANSQCKRYLNLCDPVYLDPRVWSEVDPRQILRPFVVGGKISAPKSHPHMALLGYGPDKEWLCGGSLISERFVLSAAHCAQQPLGGAPDWVRLGELDYADNKEEAGPVDYKILEIIKHPDFKEPYLYNDIALYKLDGVVEFNPFIRPVCLHSSLTIPFAKVTATGWGRVGFAEDLSNKLMEVDLSVLASSSCGPLYKNSSRYPLGYNAHTMVCVGEKDGGKDTCSGDSGGPIVIQTSNKCLRTQVGITSFGRQCGLPDTPAIYTRVAAFTDWIEKIVWPDSPADFIPH